MTRTLAIGAALLCALPLLGACTPGSLTPTDVASLTTAAATTAPTLPAGANVSQVLAEKGVTPAAQAAVKTDIAKVQQAAAKLCSYRALASGILNVAIAASPNVATVANSQAGMSVRGVATIICNGLQSAPTYAALGSRKGELVRATVTVNGRDVPVYGVRLR